jgi:hypothetical protein
MSVGLENDIKKIGFKLLEGTLTSCIEHTRVQLG